MATQDDLTAAARADLEVAVKLCEKWFATGAKASWCPAMAEDFAKALQQTRQAALEECEKLARRNHAWWSNDIPTKAGYYWLTSGDESGEGPTIVQLYHHENGALMIEFMGMEPGERLEAFVDSGQCKFCQWQGPIEPME